MKNIQVKALSFEVNLSKVKRFKQYVEDQILYYKNVLGQIYKSGVISTYNELDQIYLLGQQIKILENILNRWLSKDLPTIIEDFANKHIATSVSELLDYILKWQPKLLDKNQDIRQNELDLQVHQNILKMYIAGFGN